MVGVKGGFRWRVLNDLSLNAQGEFRSKETAGISKNTIIARANLNIHSDILNSFK